MNRTVTINFTNGTSTHTDNVSNARIDFGGKIFMFQTSKSFDDVKINNELTTRQIDLELVSEIKFN